MFLDHGHYTFEGKRRGAGLLRLFRERCVFSGRMLQLLFGDGSGGGSLAARVMRRMGPALVTLNDAYREEGAKGGAGRGWVETKLAVVDQQLARLATAVAECAAKHDGTIDVV